MNNIHNTLADVAEQVTEFLETDRDVSTMFDLSPETVVTEFCRIAGDIAYYNALTAETNRLVLTAKANYDKVKAQAFLVERELQKLTVDALKAKVETRPDVEDARLQMVSAEVHHSRVRGISDALRTKKDMLVSLGAHMRAEMGGSPSIKEPTTFEKW